MKYIVITSTYQSKEEVDFLIQKILPLYIDKYNHIIIPTYSYSKVIENEDIILLFGLPLEEEIRAFCDKNKLDNVKIYSLPRPSKLYKSDDNKESRTATHNILSTLKQVKIESLSNETKKLSDYIIQVEKDNIKVFTLSDNSVIDKQYQDLFISREEIEYIEKTVKIFGECKITFLPK